MTSLIKKLTINGDPRSALTIEDCTELARVLRAQQNRIGELLQERDELAARVERLRDSLGEIAYLEGCRQDESGVIAVHALAETPFAAIEALKAK